MKTLSVALHVHERSSLDSLAAPATMARAYQNAGADLVGFVAHQAHVDAAREAHNATRGGVMAVDGIEHGPGSGKTHPHVVEFPEHDFAYLAHPRKTWPERTKAHAAAFVREHGLDGVERFNAGRQQYRGAFPEPVVELAGDDAHSPRGVRRSTMTVHATERTPAAVFDALRHGNFEINNHGPRFGARASKALALSVAWAKGDWSP